MKMFWIWARSAKVVRLGQKEQGRIKFIPNGDGIICRGSTERGQCSRPRYANADGAAQDSLEELALLS